jgi:hypothetical protein
VLPFASGTSLLGGLRQTESAPHRQVPIPKDVKLVFNRFASGLPTLVLATALSAIGATHATAQETGQPGAGFRPSAPAVRIDASEAPIIDADLSDPVWAKASVISDLREKEPVPGAPPQERTEVRILYDENNLYFGVYAYDSQPEGIVVRTMERDGRIFTGDMIGINLDPGLTRRNAYAFQIAPTGGRADALFLNNTEDLSEWNGIWLTRAAIVEDGWVAEVAIPIQTLSYEEGQTDWGFDFRRVIQRTNEELYWSSTNPNLATHDVSQAGTLTGLDGFDQGLGLELQVYGVSRVKRDWHIPGEDTGISFSGGGNAFYRITPALTGTLTYNPDFSDAPLDARQVNTTRFSLFFPETREFFLQDAGRFEFGGRGFTRGGDARVENNGRPFFSRNLGLVGGQPVSIVGGTKLSGELAGFGVGVLSVLTDSTPDADGQILSVARISHPVFDESQLGVIVTHGDPTGATTNTVAGIDFQHRDSNFWGGNVFQADAFYLRSYSSDLGNDDSFGLALNFPDEPWGGELVFKEVGANYTPALGFVNRTGIRAYQANARYVARFSADQNPFMRQLQISANNFLVTGLDDVLQSREDVLEAEAITHGNHLFAVGVISSFENVTEPFDLPDDVPVPIGKYEWTNFTARFQTSRAYAFSLRGQVTCCSFYDGSSVETSVLADYRPNQYYGLQASHQFTHLDMPNGTINIHVASLNAVLTFTPDMEVAVQTQYDNISQNIGFLARYRWEFITGDELLIAFGQAATVSTSRFQAQRSQLTVRVGHTMRF